jgi:hypothetical protein
VNDIPAQETVRGRLSTARGGFTAELSPRRAIARTRLQQWYATLIMIRRAGASEGKRLPMTTRTTPSRFHPPPSAVAEESRRSGDRSELHSGYPAPAATTRPPRATNGGEATAATPTPTANPELPSQQSGSQIIQLSGTGTNRQVYRGRESAVRRITNPTQAARWLSRIPGITDGCCRSSR